MRNLNLCGEWMVKTVYDCTDALKLSINPNAEDFIPASVPGDIHIDLLRAGKIPDPYYGDNVNLCKWVAERNWCFVKEFYIPDGFVSQITEMTFKGIDTFSEIYLNGIHIGSTSSMFYRYTYDVRFALRAGRNVLAVMIKSAADEIKKYPHDGYSTCFNHERIFIRKSQCHFSWDWAPELLATGIFDEVILQSYPACPIRDVFVRTMNAGHAVFLFNFGGKPLRAAERSIRLSISGGGFTKEYQITDIPLSGDKQYIVQIENPKLWWPAGYGDQPLYEYSAELFENGEMANRYQGRFAFRQVEIDETPADSLKALKFNVKINGVPVFLKGANWVNADIFTGSVTNEKYRKLLSMVPAGNMNCLRVWGGGFYEKDVFYDLCDELGILIWQDFMFSCAELPEGFPGFYEKVEEELIQQITRLRNHPCIALWSGGNERPGGIADEPCKGEDKFKFLFRGIANHLDPTRPYIYNSPFGYEKPGNSLTSGDVHLSSMTAVFDKHASQYKAELAKLEAPLMSEIACMGSSPVENIRKYIPESSLWPPDDIWVLHVRGNPYDGLNENFVIQQQRLATQHFGEIDSLEDFSKKSSIVQMEHIKADVEFHRSRAFDCSGALLWMFDDIWPCGSWAIVDYYLTKKAGYFGMKRACRPVLPLITLRKDGLKAFAVNDTRGSVTADIQIIQQDLCGEEVAVKVYKNITLPRGSTLISDLSDFDVNRRNSMFFIRLKNRELDVWNSYCTLPFDRLDLPSPSVSVNLKQITDGEYVVCLESDTVARTVYLKAPCAEFDDNYFDLPAGVPFTVSVYSDQPLNPSDLQVLTFIDDWK